MAKSIILLFSVRIVPLSIGHCGQSHDALFPICPQNPQTCTRSSETNANTPHPLPYTICTAAGQRVLCSLVSLFNMAPRRAYVSLFQNSFLNVDLWKRFVEDEELSADIDPPVKVSLDMASAKSSGSKSSVSLTASEQEQAVSR